MSTHSAAPSATGYEYQFDRALLWLLESTDDGMVGIETDDDVFVASATGAAISEQLKYSVNPNSNPLTNKSLNLWKTLHIWVNAVVNRKVNLADTSFHLVTTGTISAGLAQEISMAKTKTAANACVSKLKKIAKELPETHKKFAKTIQDIDKDVLRDIILNCSVYDSKSLTSIPLQRKRIIARMQIPVMFDSNSIFDEVSGWLRRTVLDKWERKEEAWISVDSVRNQLFAVKTVRKLTQQLERCSESVSVDSRKVQEARPKTFVRQLQLILESEEEEIESAITDYIRFNIEKLRIETEGIVTTAEWSARDARLTERWKKIRSKLMHELKDPKTIGRNIYFDTAALHLEPLQNIPTSNLYFTAGAYHRLADFLTVGWHPTYESHFSGGSSA